MPTIAAIATPPGQGGIGIIRISGPDAKTLLRQVFVPAARGFTDYHPWKLQRGMVLDGGKKGLDDALAVFMPGPATFTGEDVAEIHCHGSPLVLESLLANLVELGARLAGRGEFSRRAFLNGRMDLSQAEAVAELIAAPSREALRNSLSRLEGGLGRMVRGLREDIDDLRAHAFIGVDFPDDEVPPIEDTEFAARVASLLAAIRELLQGAERARFMQEGALVALAGAVNAGKSSLLNAISGRERALVTPLPGTTRDYIEENISLDGMPCRLVDTAGLRDDTARHVDQAESMGMARSLELVARADLTLVVFDGALMAAGMSQPGEDELYRRIAAAATGSLIYVWNKCDLAMPDDADWAGGVPSCAVSAASGENLDTLCAMARNMLCSGNASMTEGAIAPNVRQSAALRLAEKELCALQERGCAAWDLNLARLDAAAEALDEILGLSAHDELMNRIFSNFCIGK